MTRTMRRFTIGKPHVVALYDGSAIHFIDHDRQMVTDLGQIDIPNSPSRRLDTQSEVLVRQIVDSRKPVVLRLTEDMGLVSYDRFPETASQDLRSIVAHRLDSLTPWSADKVMYDAKSMGRLGNGQIEVQIIAAPREEVEAGIHGLGAIGLTAAAADIVIDFPNAPCTLNLLGGTETVQGLGISAWAASAAALLALIVGGLVYLDVSSRQAQIEERRTFVNALQGRLEDLPELRLQLERLQHQTDVIADRRREQPSVLLVIEDLSKTLPDGVWLKRLAISERQLSISGFAPDAELLLELLEDHRAFSGVEFTAATRRQEVETEDSFVMADSFALQSQIEAPGTRLPAIGDSP